MLSRSAERYWQEELMPKIEHFSAHPINPDDLSRMRQIREEQGVSTSYSAAFLVNDMGHFLQERCTRESARFGRAVRVDKWYPIATHYLQATELAEGGMNIAEEVLKRADKRFFRGRLVDLGLSPELIALSTKIHLFTGRLQQLLSQDPNRSGFPLVDYVLSSPEFDEEFEGSGYAPIARRLAVLGVERFKRSYLAATTGFLA